MIFITGPHCVGKTTIAKKLQHYGFVHIETGDIVRKEYRKEVLGIEFHMWALNKNHMFNNFIAQAIMDKCFLIKQSKGNIQDILVTGNRQINGIKYLIKNVPPVNHKPDFIIYVEADERILYTRYIKRQGRTKKQLTFKKFKDEVLGFDIKMGLKQIRNKADLIVCNNSRIGICIDNIKEFLKNNGYIFPDVS